MRVAASLTVASALRQTDRHADARAFDRRALRIATRASDRSLALTGLAADCIGLGDARACARLLTRASAETPRRDWRARVRLDWVSAERALMTGDARAAVRHSERALRRSRAAGALRHEAKSLLFLGVASAAAGEPERGARALGEAERLARRCGADPIRTIARSVRTGQSRGEIAG